MSPPWVLLYRRVHFTEGESADDRAGEAAAPLGVASLEVAAAALTPDLVVVDPPGVSSLVMVQHLPKYLLRGIERGEVSSSDKGLVVLYAGTTGTYRPGNNPVGIFGNGCYLVYDASSTSSSLSAIPPPLEQPAGVKCLGTSAAILRCRYGVYVLAELVASGADSGLPNAHLYLWRSSTPPTGQTPTAGGQQWASLSSARQWLPACQWVPTEVRLPLPTELCGPTCFFHIDMAFAFEEYVCWVDLRAGVLICDLFATGGPNKFSFVPLPQGCCLYPLKEDDRLEISASAEFRLGIGAAEFCSMSVVCGAIKFVSLVGYSEGLPKAEVHLKTWKLSSDFKEWKEGPGVLVRDLWESQSFREMELPKGLLTNPVMSMNEDEIIYISLSDIEFVPTHDFLGHCTGQNTVLNGHYWLRLDLLQNKVLYSKKSATDNLSSLMPFVFASNISAYLHDGSKIHHQREEEASKVGTTVKY